MFCLPLRERRSSAKTRKLDVFRRSFFDFVRTLFRNKMADKYSHNALQHPQYGPQCTATPTIWPTMHCNTHNMAHWAVQCTTRSHPAQALPHPAQALPHAALSCHWAIYSVHSSVVCLWVCRWNQTLRATFGFMFWCAEAAQKTTTTVPTTKYSNLYHW